MPILDGVEVRIARNVSGNITSDIVGEQLLEYGGRSRSSSEDEERKVEQYIEAITGQEIQIEVYFHQNFKLYNAKGVRIHLTVDQYTIVCFFFCDKERVAYYKLSGRPLIISSVCRADGRRFSMVSLVFTPLALGTVY